LNISVGIERQNTVEQATNRLRTDVLQRYLDYCIQLYRSAGMASTKTGRRLANSVTVRGKGQYNRKEPFLEE